MGLFAKGDIVIFPFPYTDLKDRKLRPCLVLSSEMHDDILLCQITSSVIKKDEFSVEIDNLRVKSYIRANMLFTADKNQISKKIASVSSYKYDEVVSKIIKAITR
ncbi:MAG: type II toxin-antitoxin system PemK/MazF family toxin [Candidatus Woesearchaeota archaeon]